MKTDRATFTLLDRLPTWAAVYLAFALITVVVIASVLAMGIEYVYNKVTRRQNIY